jgi:hypothetical protein
MSATHTFVQRTGLALVIGGALTIVVNAGLTPRLPQGASLAETAASTAFLWRQAVSGVAALMLALGSIGLYLRQIDRAGVVTALAFIVAFAGSAFLLAVEWSQVFEIRDLALRAPATLTTLDAADGVSLSDMGAMIALATFVIGWLALAIVTLRCGLFPRQAAWLVIAGFFATPVLAAILPGVAAAALGNAILGAGWIWLGITLATPALASQRATVSRE